MFSMLRCKRGYCYCKYNSEIKMVIYLRILFHIPICQDIHYFSLKPRMTQILLLEKIYMKRLNLKSIL